jgi:nitrite reductase/ring-hydroxylating ferredoxin subunit
VANRNGQYKAVSARCRHQLADLSKGAVDADGCLVCPWHASRYDLDSGEMVSGPQGFANYQGPTPGYSGFVRWTIGRFLPLRRRQTRVEDERVVVEG